MAFAYSNFQNVSPEARQRLLTQGFAFAGVENAGAPQGESSLQESLLRESSLQESSLQEQSSCLQESSGLQTSRLQEQSSLQPIAEGGGHPRLKMLTHEGAVKEVKGPRADEGDAGTWMWDRDTISEAETHWYSRIPLPQIEPVDPSLYPFAEDDEMANGIEGRRLAALSAFRDQETAHSREIQAGNELLAESSGNNMVEISRSIAEMETSLEELAGCPGVGYELEGPQNRDLALRAMQVDEQEAVLPTRVIPITEVHAGVNSWRESLGAELDSLVTEHQAVSPLTEEEVRALECDSAIEVVRMPGKVVAAIKPPLKRKARLVACGNYLHRPRDRSSPTLDRRDIYAAGLDTVSLRTQIAVGSRKGWQCATLDVRTAFLTAPYQASRSTNVKQRVVVVKVPRAMILAGLLPANSWLRVQGALYGLRESPSSWGASRDEKLQQIRWKGSKDQTLQVVQRKTDVSLWLVKEIGTQRTIGSLGVYVDDLMLWVDKSELEGAL